MNQIEPAQADPIRLEIFKHLFAAIPEEMGAVLRRASFSPNIKERLDFSCALFDSQARMVAQAAHIPVHLGAMPISVRSARDAFMTSSGEPDLLPGDVIILNDPYLGGSHLPDITLVSPVFIPGESETPRLFGFAASRAHHADVGGMKPGSMPIATELIQEGVVIPPIKILRAGQINRDAWDLLLANVRTPEERAGDLHAQLAANRRGVARYKEMVSRYGARQLEFYSGELMAYTERLARSLIRSLPEGRYEFEDFLDGDGISAGPIPIRVTLTIERDRAVVDFSRSAPQQRGSVNAVYAITLSAVAYVFRSLLGLDVPNNAGAMVPIKVIAPLGSVVNARRLAPVAGGNVETSQRITDVLLGALAKALPDRIPAASQGTMNNTLIGGMDPRHDPPRPFTYYETIAGGMGGHAAGDGMRACHSHMTNTRNTPVEALEYAYPILVERYEIRRGTGGAGRHRGGDGLRRDIRLLAEAEASLITDRRDRGPYGLQGGAPGAPGENWVLRGGEWTTVSAKGSFDLQPGDVLSVRTPGGGGWGEPE